VLLFVRYVSDKYGGDKSGIVVIPEGGSFKELVALKDKTNIGKEAKRPLKMALQPLKEALQAG